MKRTVLVINPNSSIEMTRIIENSARSAARLASVEVLGNPDAPEGINTEADELAAIEKMLELPVVAHLDAYHAVVVACFGDPGVSELQERTDRPVIGIAQAAMRWAATKFGSFGVLAASEDAGLLMTSLVDSYGLDTSCRGVVTLGIDVVSLARNGDHYLPLMEERVDQLVRGNGAASVLLGCTALGPWAAHLSIFSGTPVVDAVYTSIHLLEQAGLPD